jgi:quinol monooxygenase YgiN
MAHWVQSNEPGTTSYSMSFSDKNPLLALVFEQYTDKHAYADVHKTSSHFLAFKKEMMAMNDESSKDKLGWKMSGESFRQPVGFI